MLRKLRKQTQAVSPVIATLMLVLVSVGAAGAFYAWQTGWQQDSTDQMSDFDGKSQLLIGGSSTVYEFTAIAAPLFEKAYPNVKVSYQAGGSGSGVIGAGEGVVDIGSASRYVKSTEYATYPDLIEHTVAYDAIVMIVSDDNTHIDPESEGLTITDIQAVYHINGGVAWANLPANVKTWALSPTGPFEFGNVSGNPQVNWTDGTKVNIYERADHSGTEDVFCAKLLRGDEKQLDEQSPAINCPYKSTGNADLLSDLAADPHGLSFMSFGAAKENNDVDMLDIDFGDGYVEPTENNIKKPVGDSDKYESYRPINYITLGDASGYAKIYLEFVRQTMTNQDIADECGYMSIY